MQKKRTFSKRLRNCKKELEKQFQVQHTEKTQPISALSTMKPRNAWASFRLTSERNVFDLWQVWSNVFNSPVHANDCSDKAKSKLAGRWGGLTYKGSKSNVFLLFAYIQNKDTCDYFKQQPQKLQDVFCNKFKRVEEKYIKLLLIDIWNLKRQGPNINFGRLATKQGLLGCC